MSWESGRRSQRATAWQIRASSANIINLEEGVGISGLSGRWSQVEVRVAEEPENERCPLTDRERERERDLSCLAP